MKHFIGGLFRNREEAEEAQKALQETGMEETSIDMLQCTHEKEIVVLEQNPSIKSIGKGGPNRCPDPGRDRRSPRLAGGNRCHPHPRSRTWGSTGPAVPDHLAIYPYVSDRSPACFSV
jgi:hypothetical protein